MKITEVEAIPVWYELTDEYHALFGSGKKAGSSVHAREGWFANISKEGTPIYTAFSRVHSTGWTMALFASAAAVDAPGGAWCGFSSVVVWC